jgi:UrcA family protein
MLKLRSRLAVGVALPLVVSAALAFPGAASAETETIRRTVSYRDLDLTRPEDAARLKLRLDLAVRRMCGGEAPSPFERRIAYETCVEGAKAGAQGQLAAAVLAAKAPSALAQAEP